jgi:two-component system, OmpR family, sensor kinase
VTGLRTTSLRRRVTLTALGVLGVVLVAAGIAVHAVVTTQAERGLDTLIAGRLQLARQLARADVAPAALVRRVDGPGLVVRLRLPSGAVLGETAPASDVRVVTARLTGSARLDGARLTITADTAPLAGAERTLRGVLFGAGVAALALTALGLVFGVRFALAPLDGMTDLARSIAAGRRGGRLRPTRPATELGRTATAFDDMLDALEGAERAARQSEDRVRRFVADATHELRTPIAGVRAAAEALLSTGDDVEQRDRLLLLLVRESSRAGHLVDDLLALARIDAGLTLAAEPVDLLALATAHADGVRLLAPDVEVTVTGDRVWVTGDGARLVQVLTNLTDNARRAMAGAGVLTIDVRRAGPALLTVTDSGPGIPPEHHERVFDRLVRLDEARTTPGAGLGLPIARGIARAHGGDLRCLPAAHGATFELRLP